MGQETQPALAAVTGERNGLPIGPPVSFWHGSELKHISVLN
jgi:hypothetical protein